jgi:hypothetical protein
VTPYLWGAGIDGKVSVLGHTAAGPVTAEIDADVAMIF